MEPLLSWGFNFKKKSGFLLFFVYIIICFIECFRNIVNIVAKSRVSTRGNFDGTAFPVSNL